MSEFFQLLLIQQATTYIYAVYLITDSGQVCWREERVSFKMCFHTQMEKLLFKWKEQKKLYSKNINKFTTMDSFAMYFCEREIR